MKPISTYTLLLVFSVLSLNIQAQTIIEEVDVPLMEDAMVNMMKPDENFGDSEEIIAMAWFCGGGQDTCILRSLLSFDLSVLPEDVHITYAGLSLYAATLGSNPNHFGLNESYLRRITATWEENSVTWNNQPGTVVENQVLLAQSDNAQQDYVDIDVTELVRDMVANPDASFGFMLQLKDENIFRSMNFFSSDFSNENLHPVLLVNYEESTTTGLASKDCEQLQLNIYPNPVRDAFRVDYMLDKAMRVEIVLYDLYGKPVRVLFSGMRSPGNHTEFYQSKQLVPGPGVYLLGIHLDNGSLAKRKIVVAN